MNEKKTPEEILREQLELLAERSHDCCDEALAGITSAMIEIYGVLQVSPSSRQFHLESE